MPCRACGLAHPSHVRCEVWARQHPVSQSVSPVKVVSQRDRKVYMRGFMQAKRAVGLGKASRWPRA